MFLQNVNNLINSVENAKLTETSKLCMNNLVVFKYLLFKPSI